VPKGGTIRQSEATAGTTVTYLSHGLVTGNEAGNAIFASRGEWPHRAAAVISAI
jgi:hypothetical protein